MSNYDVFEKFNEQFDIAGLQEDIANAGSQKDFVEVPDGDYEVAIEKLELAESKKGLPMAKCWFKIVTGDFKGQLIFMNQMLTSGYGFKIMNDFLESLESGLDIGFVDFPQYAELLESVRQAVEGDEYQLSYGHNEKGFGSYNIVQKFPKD